MSHQNLYHELSKKVGTENSRIVPEIWQTVCTPEEAMPLNLLPANMEELIQHLEKHQEEVIGMLVPSRYQAAIDDEGCTGCEACVGDCPMDAINMNEENTAILDREACIGCGICASVCPEDAISLIIVRQEDFIPS